MFFDICTFLDFMHLKSHFLFILGRFGSYLDHQETLLERLGGLMRPSWGTLGLPWGLLERLLGTFVGLMAPLGAPWGVLEHLGRLFWRSWLDFGRFWST